MTDTDRKKLYHWFDTRVKVSDSLRRRRVRHSYSAVDIGEQAFFYVITYEERLS